MQPGVKDSEEIEDAADQFGPEQPDTVKEDERCVPSSRTVLPVPAATTE